MNGARHFRQHLSVTLVTLFLLGGCAGTGEQVQVPDEPATKKPATDAPEEVRSALGRQLELIVENRYPVYGHALPNATVEALYKNRRFEPLWFDEERPRPELTRLVSRLRHADRHGLVPGDYYLTGLRRATALNFSDDREIAELDILATIALMTYAQDMSSGRFDPRLIDPNWQLDMTDNAWRELTELPSARDMLAHLDTLAPQNSDYESLQYWYRYYLDRSNQQDDVRIDRGNLLLLGSRDPRVNQVRQRLRQLGDLTGLRARATEPELFDSELERAVRRFQSRHQLVADGRVGRQTLSELNVPMSVRAEQLRFNMERWRWLPAEIEAEHIWVDLAAYQVDMHVNGEHRSMRTVIGQPERPTRVFRGEMTYMEINPTWRVPQSIARDMLLPIAQVDPDYFTRNNFRIYEGWYASARELDPQDIDWQAIEPEDLGFRIEQEPDPGNAMGEFKFMFPNRNAIYLHDTPERDDFSDPVRAYSAGCVRLHDPSLFANTLLSGNEIKLDRMARAREENRSHVIELDQPVPIYLVYFTAQANEMGPPSFRPDIYQRDPLMAKAMSPAPLSDRVLTALERTDIEQERDQ